MSLANGVTATYADKNAGTEKTVNYSGIALTGDKVKNYNLVNAATATGKGTIEKANVIFTVKEGYTREYDGTTSATGAAAKITSGQLFGTDAISGGTFAFTDKNAGTGKAITVSDVTINDGNNGGNYNVTYTDGTGEITRKALELVADAKTITEGEATPTFTGSVTGFVENERLGESDTLVFNVADPAPTTKGKYAVTGTLNGNASGEYGDNYTFANAAANDTAFTIKAKYVPPTPAPTPTPEPTPMPQPTPTPPASEPTQELPRALETIVGNEQTAKEYTDTITALESGKTVSLPTGDAAKQEQTALRPAIQTEQSQSAATKTEHSLGIAYNDIRMPESMTAEALAAALSEEKAEQTPTLSADTKAVLATEAIADRETAETDEEDE